MTLHLWKVCCWWWGRWCLAFRKFAAWRHRGQCLGVPWERAATSRLGGNLRRETGARDTGLDNWPQMTVLEAAEIKVRKNKKDTEEAKCLDTFRMWQLQPPSMGYRTGKMPQWEKRKRVQPDAEHGVWAKEGVAWVLVPALLSIDSGSEKTVIRPNGVGISDIYFYGLAPPTSTPFSHTFSKAIPGPGLFQTILCILDSPSELACFSDSWVWQALWSSKVYFVCLCSFGKAGKRSLPSVQSFGLIKIIYNGIFSLNMPNTNGLDIMNTILTW